MATAENNLTRAEQVRARRLHRREDKPIVNRLAGAAKSAASLPRMVARNAQTERRLQAVEERTHRRPRYIKLAEAGAELRLPALPSVQVGWRVVSGALVALCLLLLYGMATSVSFRVARVQLQGAQRLDGHAINNALGITGQSIFAIEPDKLYTTLREQFPELERVAVSVGLPGGVTVTVKEREPLIVWEQAGLVLWLDAAGVAFMPQGDTGSLIRVTALDAPPALAANAPESHQFIRPEMVFAIQALDRIAPDDAPLIYDPKLGFGWSDPGGWQAFFGQDGKDIDQRLAVYLQILDELRARRLVPSLISVAQLHAPYYRMDY
ncbi:MAG TPA: FtsQ-type POTRA domain-containing protein [Anaerolineales bacterium]|nr:FtsQ-type POTRA domain-containing protein [Anaerolineales bacterium]HRQ92835.1 FtsQ-type POTRA domain-containing protein [Anaerolineales bacterium]